MREEPVIPEKIQIINPKDLTKKFWEDVENKINKLISDVNSCLFFRSYLLIQGKSIDIDISQMIFNIFHIEQLENTPNLYPDVVYRIKKELIEKKWDVIESTAEGVNHTCFHPVPFTIYTFSISKK